MLVLPTGTVASEDSGTELLRQLLSCKEVARSNQQYLDAVGQEDRTGAHTATKCVCVLQGEQALVPLGSRAKHGADLVIGGRACNGCVILGSPQRSCLLPCVLPVVHPHQGPSSSLLNTCF